MCACVCVCVNECTCGVRACMRVCVRASEHACVRACVCVLLRFFYQLHKALFEKPSTSSLFHRVSYSNPIFAQA